MTKCPCRKCKWSCSLDWSIPCLEHWSHFSPRRVLADLTDFDIKGWRRTARCFSLPLTQATLVKPSCSGGSNWTGFPVPPEKPLCQPQWTHHAHGCMMGWRGMFLVARWCPMKTVQMGGPARRKLQARGCTLGGSACCPPPFFLGGASAFSMPLRSVVTSSTRYSAAHLHVPEFNS